MKQPSQKIIVLKHLLRYGSITDKRARDSYGITRLAARIDELLDPWTWDDPPIDREMVAFTTRLGRRGRYAKYVALSKPELVRQYRRELEVK